MEKIKQQINSCHKARFNYETYKKISESFIANMKQDL